MKILIYGLNYNPELTGIGRYSGELGAWLAQHGEDVRVITTAPYYPSWQVWPGYRSCGYSREIGTGGETVFRGPLWVPRSVTPLRRILHLCSFALGSVPHLLKQISWHPDVIFMVEPAFSGVPFGLVFGFASGAKTWLHIQDFEIDAAFELGMLPHGGALQRVLTKVETRCMKMFERVSSITPNMVNRCLAKGVAPEKLYLLPNWVDAETIYPLPTASPYRETLGLQCKFVLLYSGNLGRKQGLEVLPKLAFRLRRQADLHVVIAGDGAYRPELVKQAEGLTNITFLPLQPVDRLNEFLNLADIHLLPQQAGAADLVMPSKLTGMMASGRPVIATAEQGTQLSAVLNGRGITVKPGDLDSLVAAVEQLYGDVEMRNRMGQTARQYAVNHLGRDSILKDFQSHLHTLDDMR